MAETSPAIATERASAPPPSSAPPASRRLVRYRARGASRWRFVRAYTTTFQVIFSYLWLFWKAKLFGGAYRDAKLAASPSTLALLQHLTVFVMAIFVGFQVVWNVTPALHTPLMSVTNAISGIIVIGGLLNARGSGGSATMVAVAATLFATINIAGGFLVTRRMLAMFRK